MDVCYATNSKYFDLMLVSILSLEKYNTGCNIHILHSSLSLNEILKLNSVSKSNIKFYYVSENNLRSIIQNMNDQNSHFTVENFFRLLIPKYVDLDKILYLDVDTMIRSDISELFEISLSNKPLAAVNWYEVSKAKLRSLGMYLRPIYFNSGIMLMNLTYFREKFLINDLISKFTNDPKRYPLVDQDLLNEVVNGTHYVLDEKYNYTQSTTKKLKFNKKIKIVHFAGKIKPFYKFIPHPFKKEFKAYWTSEVINNKIIINIYIIKEKLNTILSYKSIIGRIDFLRKLKWKILKEDGKWIRREY